MRSFAVGSSVLLVAVVIAYTTTASAGNEGWTVERYSAHETWNSFADIGKKDNGGPGDVYTSQQTLTSVDGSTVGIVNGFGVNLHKPYVFFHWTASLRGGSITIESAINLMHDSAVYPIAGGTGRYAGVRGTVTLSDRSNNRSVVVVRYRQ